MPHLSALFKKGLLIPIFLFIFLILAPHFDLSTVEATNNVQTGCAVTPDQLDGQGLNITGLGLNITGLGLNITGLGLSITGLGLNITGLNTTPEQIVADIVNNPVTPAWLTSLLPDVNGGPGYNGTPTVALIVDDFSRPDGHGSEVRKVFDDLYRALDTADDSTLNNSPNIRLENINIGDPVIGFQTVGIASSIRDRINLLSGQGYKHFVINMSFGVIPCNSTENVTLVDSESGQTFNVTNDFSYDAFENRQSQVLAPTASKKAVVPILECVVKNGHKSYTAYFGYRSDNPVSVEIPIGLRNFFLIGGHGRGQPETFGPGRQEFVFKVNFDGFPLSWILKGPDHKIRTATASSSPNLSCASKGITPPTQLGAIAPVGFGITDYVTSSLGVPENFVDEYMEHLATSVEEDPINGLQPLLKSLLQRTYTEDTDGNPNTIFAVIPVASSGNSRNLFGANALSPANFPESIAASATLGDFGPLWVLSQDGNLTAPGAGYPFAFDAAGNPTQIGAGTSFSAPFISMLSALWLTYPDACTYGNGLPPVVSAASSKNANAISRVGTPSRLACAKPVVASADLVLTKADVYDPVNVGGDVAYTLTVTNNGPSIANNVVVTDTLPAGTTFKSASTNQGSCTGPICNLGNVAPGQTVTINLVIVAPATAGSINNTASVVSTTSDPNNANNSGAAGTTINAIQLLPVVPITECVTNFGNGVYRAYFGYDNPNSVPVTIPVGIKNRIQPAPENRGQPLTLLPGRQFDAFYVDFDGNILFWKLDGNYATADKERFRSCADVGVVVFNPVSQVTVGQAFRYELAVGNPSTTTVQNVVLTDALPAGLSLVSIPPTCTADSANVITCPIGSINGGSHTVFPVDVIATQPGIITNVASITSLEGPKGNPNNNSASVTTTVIAAPASDTDGDGVSDPVDNCPSVSNGDQADSDGDAIGNACDNDGDNDGIANEVDNCSSVPNDDQTDSDGDAIGDACDGDGDNDGIANEVDNCSSVPNDDQTDSDGDSAGNACDSDDDNDTVADEIDNCPIIANTDQVDSDVNGIGDVCDEGSGA